MNRLHYSVKSLCLVFPRGCLLKLLFHGDLKATTTTTTKKTNIKKAIIYKIDFHFSSDVTAFHGLIYLHHPPLDVGKSVS